MICPRCASERHTMASCIEVLRQTSARSAHALEALQNRRLAVPSAVPVALQEAKLDCRIVAERLACIAGTCQPKGEK